MSYRVEKEDGGNNAIVWGGFETGISPSPHKGIANIQNANIATELAEIMAGYGRTLSTLSHSSSGGVLTRVASDQVSLTQAGSNNIYQGIWITVTGSSNTGQLPNATYWVLSHSSTDFQLATTYGGNAVTGLGVGLTAAFTPTRELAQPVAYCIEKYNVVNTEYRYYLLDSQGLVWIFDTFNTGTYWELPDTSISYFGSDTAPSGIAVLNGWLMVFSGNKIWVKPTANNTGLLLGTAFARMTNAVMMSTPDSTNPHFAYTGHQGRTYYTDGTYVGSIFPDSSLLSGVANIQSFAQYSSSSTTGTIATIYSGSIPSTGFDVGVTGFSRIPAVFFSQAAGVMPAALTADTVYWIAYDTSTVNFQVFAAQTGGSAIDITTGKTGFQYFNTFYPTGAHAGAYGDTSTMVFSPQRLNLPVFETAKSMTEVGNTLVIGGITSALYPWNQIDATPSSIINLPENNTTFLLTVNQMAYAFSGNKGNIYITDGSIASLVLKVPDYCAGIPGTPASYFEPTFTWGGAMYLRGRVYFSILDQTSTKAGNCGGVWSFIPTQNLYIGQDTGLALRLENQNSYATYNGVATVLIPNQTQTSISPQYYSGWYSSISSATYGIDKTGTFPAGTVVFELDLTPVGTVLNKYTPKQIEYKLAAPLTAGETVTAEFRVNSTDAYTNDLGAAVTESSTALSGYWTTTFATAQWVQLRITLTPLASTSSSKVRLSEVRMR